MKDFVPKKRAHRYVLVAIDNFSKFGWEVHLETKNAQTIKDSFENIIISSMRKPNLTESDRGEKIYKIFFQIFSNNNNIEHSSRKTSFGAVFAERFDRTNGDFIVRPIFEKSDSDWFDILSTKTKQ